MTGRQAGPKAARGAQKAAPAPAGRGKPGATHCGSWRYITDGATRTRVVCTKDPDNHAGVWHMSPTHKWRDGATAVERGRGKSRV